MKRVITAADTKPNKAELRREFIDLSTQIRDMGKNEFVELLKRNEFDIAQKCIDELADLRDRFADYAESAIDYLCVKVLVDGDFVGYVGKLYHEPGARGHRGSVMLKVTDNLDESEEFSSEREFMQNFRNYPNITIYRPDDTGYRYEPRNKDKAGQLDQFSSQIYDKQMYYAGEVTFEYVTVS